MDLGCRQVFRFAARRVGPKFCDAPRDHGSVCELVTCLSRACPSPRQIFQIGDCRCATESGDGRGCAGVAYSEVASAARLTGRPFGNSSTWRGAG
jgi:hypothetical protein